MKYLLPCPFCGNTDIEKGSVCFGHGDYGLSIECKCGAKMAPYEEDAEIAWNRRTAE